MDDKRDVLSPKVDAVLLVLLGVLGGAGLDAGLAIKDD